MSEQRVTTRSCLLSLIASRKSPLPLPQPIMNHAVDWLDFSISSCPSLRALGEAVHESGGSILLSVNVAGKHKKKAAPDVSNSPLDFKLG